MSLSQYRMLNDSEWLDVNLQAVDDPTRSPLLPKLPSEGIQVGFVGSSGQASLREGFNFYKACKAQAKRYGIEIRPDTQVLDFGMGWGRMLRFWLKDVDSDNLWGADVDPEMVNLCTSLFGCCRFVTVNAHPPSLFEANSFELIYAYSVFSHLSEDTAKQWIAEFSRILKPNGIVVATTEPRRFIELCHSLRSKSLAGTQNEAWLTALANSFVDTENCLKAYDHGEFLYAPNGGGKFRDSSFYGDALFSGKYIRKNWAEYLVLKKFIDNPNYLPQAMMVLQKKQNRPRHGLSQFFS